jgi:hypothetical protein
LRPPPPRGLSDILLRYGRWLYGARTELRAVVQHCFPIKPSCITICANRLFTKVSSIYVIKKAVWHVRRSVRVSQQANTRSKRPVLRIWRCVSSETSGQFNHEVCLISSRSSCRRTPPRSVEGIGQEEPASIVKAVHNWM